jgi:hypothetical protein
MWISWREEESDWDVEARIGKARYGRKGCNHVEKELARSHT